MPLLIRPIPHWQLRLAVSVKGAHMVAYCANTRRSTLDQLVTLLEQFEGKAVVLTWTPQAVITALGSLVDRISLVAIPDDLRRVFKQGNVRTVESREELEVSE